MSWHADNMTYPLPSCLHTTPEWHRFQQHSTPLHGHRSKLTLATEKLVGTKAHSMKERQKTGQIEETSKLATKKHKTKLQNERLITHLKKHDSLGVVRKACDSLLNCSLHAASHGILRNNTYIQFGTGYKTYITKSCQNTIYL